MKKTLIIITIILVLAVVGYFVWKKYFKKDTTDETVREESPNMYTGLPAPNREFVEGAGGVLGPSFSPEILVREAPLTPQIFIKESAPLEVKAGVFTAFQEENTPEPAPTITDLKLTSQAASFTVNPSLYASLLQ